MKKLLYFLLAATWCSLAQAEIAVIVHPSSAIDALTEDDVARLYLGKSKSFPNGDQATPLNQEEGSATRQAFHEQVTKKNPSQYKAYWSQLVFTGKGTPPKEAANDGAIKSMVAANPGMIGYVDASAVDSSVKVVMKVP